MGAPVDPMAGAGDPVQAIAQAVAAQLQQSGMTGGGGMAGRGKGANKQDELALMRATLQRQTMLIAKLLDYLNVPFKAEDLVAADMQATDPGADPMSALQAGMSMGAGAPAGGDPAAAAGPKMAFDTLAGEHTWLNRLSEAG